MSESKDKLIMQIEQALQVAKAAEVKEITFSLPYYLTSNAYGEVSVRAVFR